jgi:hypothetical protein
MAFAGLFFGLSLLIRPLSLVVPPAVLTWLIVARPFGKGDLLEAFKPALGFAAAFAIGAAPTLLTHLTYATAPIAWGPAELGSLAGRVVADPLRFVLAVGETILHYLAADDLERLGGVSGSWQAGDWLSLPGAIIALAPTILKLMGLAGLVCLLWLERFEAAVDRVRFPLILLGFVILGSALGLVEERSLLLLGALLAVFAFAGLPSLLPGPMGGIVGLGMIGALLFFQFSGTYAARQSVAYRAADRVAGELRLAGATPNQVMTANWTFYDTRSPWKGRYRHIPVYVNSPEGLVEEMHRQGARYLVFDRQVGAQHWPRLAGLIEAERPPRGLRPIGSQIATAESPPNQIVIYTLE